MASAVDVFLRLIGDNRSAVRSFDETTEAAKRTDRAIETVQTRAQRVQATMSSLATSIGEGLGAGVPAALAVASRAFDFWDANVLAPSRARNAERVATSRTPEEALKSLVGETKDKWDWSSRKPLAALGDLLTGDDVGVRTIEQEDFVKLFSAMSAEEQAGILGAISSTDIGGSIGLKKLLPRLTDLQRVKAGGSTWAPSARGHTNVTVNTVTAHLNDGESLRAMMQRAERNNARTTTFHKP